MSSRERWIVYPLLFFALCLGARAQLDFMQPGKVEIPELSCKVIEAGLVSFESIQTEELLSGSITCQGELESDRVWANTLDGGQVRCNQLLATCPEGRPALEIRCSQEEGGRLTIFSPGDGASGTAEADEVDVQAPGQRDGVRLVVKATSRGGLLMAVNAEGQVLGKWEVPGAPGDEGHEDGQPDDDRK